MGKDPEKLFDEINVQFWDKDHDIDKALVGYDNLLLLLEHGDYDNLELEGNSVIDYKTSYVYHYDNLKQKIHSFYGQNLVVHKKLFKEGMLELDKAIQTNPENKDMLKIKIKTIENYKKLKEGEDGREHPELSEEVLKCCDKLLSIDNEDFSSWLAKSRSNFALKRYEESNECEDAILRLIQKISKTDKDFFQTITPAKQRSLSLHTKATNYYFMTGKFPYSEVGISVVKDYVEKAKKCLLEVLELDPYNEEALEDLHDIEKKDGLAERVKMAEAEKKTEKNSNRSQESESNFCENCGKSLEPTTKFCGKCGTPRT
tara:strand:- start:58 stop:1005 length:948 start_codon:yes stop_codon:yes gene_type:complete